jgi:hypothetical protein
MRSGLSTCFAWNTPALVARAQEQSLMLSSWFDPLVFALVCLGGGGLLLSLGIGLVAPARKAAALVAQALLGLMAVAAGSFAVFAGAFGQGVALWGSAAALCALYFLFVIVPSPSCAAWVAAAVGVARQPRGRLAAMLALWVFCPFAALTLVWCDIDGPNSISNSELAARVCSDDTHRTLQPHDQPKLSTDRGNLVTTLFDLPQVQLGVTLEVLESQQLAIDNGSLSGNLIHLPLGWQNCNCHGFVFTGGRYAIGGGDVDRIITDNGYQPVGNVVPGDVAVYRDAAGQVTHTGLVCGTASDGVILIESKWGRFGRFIHRHDHHPYANGISMFYRSPRPGHLLQGIYPADDAAPPSSVARS